MYKIMLAPSKLVSSKDFHIYGPRELAACLHNKASVFPIRLQQIDVNVLHTKVTFGFAQFRSLISSNQVAQTFNGLLQTSNYVNDRARTT